MDQYSFSDQNSWGTECDSQSDLIDDRDIGSSSSGVFQRFDMFSQSSAQVITSPPPSSIPLLTDASTLQKRNKRKSDAPVRRAPSAAELQEQTPGIRFTVPFVIPIPDQSKLPSIAESNEEDTSTPTAIGGSLQAVDNAKSPSPGILGDSG